MNIHKKWIMWAIGGSVVCLLGFQLFKPKVKPPKDIAIIKTIQPSIQTIHKTQAYPFVLSPWVNVNLRARVDGIVKELYFKEGTRVSKGQALMQIDDSLFQIQLKQAEATLAKNMALLKNAQNEYDRYKVLYAHNTVSKSSIDEIQAQAENFKANVSYDRATIEGLKTQIGFAKVISPIDGHIGLKQVDIGTFVRQAESNFLVNISQIDALQGIIYLPEEQAAMFLKNLKLSPSLSIEIFTLQKEKINANTQIVALNNGVNPKEGSLALKFKVDNKNLNLYAGFSGIAELKIKEYKEHLIIPEKAISMGDQGAFVYKYDAAQERVYMVPIKVIDMMNGVAVLDTKQTSLTPKDSIVIEGQVRLFDGVRARTKP